MATITSPGIGSGLDINGIISKLMAVEAVPVDALNKKEVSFQAKLSSFGTLKSATASLESRAFALKSSSLYSSKAVSSSDTTVATASANTAATPGTYVIQVTDLARAHTISSQVFTSLTDDIALADGKLKIELGTFSGGIYTANADATKTIDLGATSSSLTEVRDAINTANAGVRASIVTVADGQYKLTLTSTSVGAKQSIRLTALDSSSVPLAKDNTGLAKLYFDPTAAAGTGKEFDVPVNSEAQDAKFTVDGVELLRSSNSISDAITGVTLNLVKAGTSSLKVTANTEAVSSAFASFVSSYNELNAQLRDLTKFDQATKQGGLLLGDAGARALQNNLRGLVTSVFAGGGSVLRLADLGVSMLRDGSLEFNATKLNSAMSSNSAGVINAMTSTDTAKPGLAVSLAAQLKTMISEGGFFTGKTEGIQRSITDISKQRDRLSLRLNQIEARYRKQFTALDTLVASMQQTQQYLTQQLASITGNNS